MNTTDIIPENLLNDYPFLSFVQSYLGENQITSRILTIPELLDSGIDLNFRSSILAADVFDPSWFSRKVSEMCKLNTIYCILDEYSCEYVLMQFPGTDDPVYFIIGPFTYETMTEEKILQIFDQNKFPAQLYSTVYLYYSLLPHVTSLHVFQSLIRSIGNSLWGGPEQFRIEFVHSDDSMPKQYSSASAAPTSDAVRLIEKRYECENRLMELISLGQAESALGVLAGFGKYDMAQRISNPLRDKQNRLIIMNTLFRKAAETGRVSPFYLDQLSTRFHLRIEAATGDTALDKLVEEMIRKYCMLVKSHSLGAYSQTIQDVISYITMNLTEDLSLSSIAKKYSLSRNYLSNLFKKEVKVTLTEYVNQQRINHSIYLLNTTTLPIQTVAEFSGYLDVNYFIRIFKKHTQTTPKQYQKMIQAK